MEDSGVKPTLSPGPGRSLSFEDKRELVKRISDLPATALSAVVHMVRKSEPDHVQEVETGFTIRVDKLSDRTMEKVSAFFTHVSDDVGGDGGGGPVGGSEAPALRVPSASRVQGGDTNLTAAESLITLQSSMSGMDLLPPPAEPITRRQSLRSNGGKLSSASSPAAQASPLTKRKSSSSSASSGTFITTLPAGPPVFKKQDSFVNNPDLRRYYDIIQLIEARQAAPTDREAALKLLPTPTPMPQKLTHSDSFGDYYPLGPDELSLEQLADTMTAARAEVLALWECPQCQNENDWNCLVCMICDTPNPSNTLYDDVPIIAPPPRRGIKPVLPVAPVVVAAPAPAATVSRAMGAPPRVSARNKPEPTPSNPPSVPSPAAGLKSSPIIVMRVVNSGPPTPGTAAAVASAPPPPKLTKSASGSFVCDTCSRKFRSRSDLIAHIRTHTGEKPLKCSFSGCTKAFAHCSNLRAHERSHLGEKRYACSFPGCDRRFAHPASRNDHERTHTGPRGYPCDQPGCKESFDALSKLAKHKRSHRSRASEPAQAEPGVSKRTRNA